MPSQIPLELSRAFASGCDALPRAFEEHASCPPVHIFFWDFFHFGCIDPTLFELIDEFISFSVFSGMHYIPF